MKAALILACLVFAVYTASAQNDACTTDADCTADCPSHGGLTHNNVCNHGTCHCKSATTCSTDSDCSCNSGFTAVCTHGHCHCHHHH